MNIEDPRKTNHDPDLDRIAHATRELPDAEPPALLDQAVLNAARRATRGRTMRPWNFGWVHALSSAALVVLGVALVLQRPEAPPAEPLRVVKPPSNRLQEQPEQLRTLKVRAPDSPQAPPGSAVARELRVTSGPVAKERKDPAANEAAPQAMAEGEAAAPGRVRQGDQMALDKVGPEEETSQSLVSEALGARGERARAEAPAEGQMSAAAGEPEEWLRYILALKQEGQLEAFAAELAAFREAWPDYPLPPELTD